MKIIIKNKVFTIVKDMGSSDTGVIEWKKLVKDSKGGEFYLVKSFGVYYLYDKIKSSIILETYSVREA